MINSSIAVICRNNLTGETSWIGASQCDCKDIMLDSLDSCSSKEKDGVYFFSIDEINFSVSNRTSFTDNDGKRRNLVLDADHLKKYCYDIFNLIRSQTREFIDYTHDIQYLIGSLNAMSVIHKSQENDLGFYKSRMEKINFLSIVISAKSTFFRFLTEDLERMDKEDVSVTGKTFKVSKGTKFLAETKKKKVNVEFKCQKNTDAVVKMPDIFEFIPYSIVENAIKYGPREFDIDFEIIDGVNDVKVEIKSLGPKIDEDENTLIFERGYRGKHVRENSSFSGHGMGLFQANRASKILFGGHIKVLQRNCSISFNGVPYGETTFSITIPKHANPIIAQRR